MKEKPALLLLVLALSIACNSDKHFLVTTFAGSGVMGRADGRGTAASFSNLMGLATDTAGNIYVADSRNNLIRKIDPTGRVTTLAGDGAVGSTDGEGAAANFFFPTALTVDGRGNVYVADTHNSLIRKISANGQVTTLAGRIAGPSIPGNNTAVKFDNPSGIAVDTSGNVYVADWGNDVIRKISPGGKVTDLAGSKGVPGSKDGKGASASFYLPGGIAVDQADNVYVSDTYNNMIRKISPDGDVSTLAGKKTKGSVNGKGEAASFFHPAGIALDKEGNLYVADVGNNKIRKISPDCMVTTLAGSGDRGSLSGRDTLASFYKPYGVAVDRDGVVYVADYQNNLVRKITH